MIDTIIFDMDGLLVDSEPLWQRARIEAFGAERLRWTDHDQEHVMGSSTLGWARFLEERLEYEFTVEAIIDRVVSQMEQYYRENVPLLPGAADIMELVKGRFTLGVASGSPQRLIDVVLDQTGWRELFKEVLSSDELERGKPAPDIYLEITRRLGVPVENVVIFEDSGNGMRAGYAAGVKVIAVPGAYHRPVADVLARADLVLDSLADFTLDALRKL